MVWNVDFLGFVKQVGSQSDVAVDDDAVDRLNHRYTFALVMIFLVLVAGKQYVGQPIECWVPKEFSGDWQAYTENYCWIKNTYWVPSDEDLPSEPKQRHENIIGYYQWVPFILLGVGLSFNIPRLVWRLSHWHAGIKLQNVLATADAAAADHSEKREESIRAVAHSFESAILQVEKTRSPLSRLKGWLFCIFGNTHRGTYLSSLYLFTKLLYLTNIVVQLYLMTEFLGTNGFRILHDLTCGLPWHESGHFPRVTMCDFSIRSLGQKKQNYTVQCVLMINLFNEKIFLSLWLWYVVLLILAVGNIQYWIWRLCNSNRRVAFIRNMLKTRVQYHTEEEKMLAHFVSTRLGFDGVLILALMDASAGDVATTDVVLYMWHTYKRLANHINANDNMEGESGSALSGTPY